MRRGEDRGPAQVARYQRCCWDAGSTCLTPTSTGPDLKRLQGSRGLGFEPPQEDLKDRETGLEARPGAVPVMMLGRRCGGGGSWRVLTVSMQQRNKRARGSISSVHFSSVAQSCLTLCNPMDCSMPGFPVLHQLPELAQAHVLWVRDAAQPSHPLSSPSPPAFSIRVFSNESVLRIRWPKYWSFNFSISSSKEYSGLISLRIDWLDLLAVQGTLKSLLQHHISKASILQHLAFFIVQLSHPYMTTGKAIALTRQTFVSKVMSLLFNTLPRLVITFLPRSKRLFISWLQSPSAVILEPEKVKSLTVYIASPSICHEVVGPNAMILVF